MAPRGRLAPAAAEELLEELEEPPEEAELVEPPAVIAVPEGATSHHFAPKLSLPWPFVLPALLSAMK